MKSMRYVWIILLLLTLYVLYSYNYQKTVGMRLHFLHDNILSTFFALTRTIQSSFPGQIKDKEKLVRLLTADELAQYSTLEDGLYLAILGQVYDVTKGKKHYGPGGAYRAFVGRDASLAFVTGDFTDEGLTDDVSSLTPSQIKSLHDWGQFYAKDYVYKGKLVGRYFDSNGNPTKQYQMVQEKLALADMEKSDEEQKKRMFPPCNIEWKPEVGTRVWCTKRSGGIERNWIGVPRMLYEAGSEQYRCTCVNLRSKEYETHKGSLREYEGCAEGATNCLIPNSEQVG
ncbi:neuferricin [Athalia rosae]|uniref:neuferricin n=1 Tax=Athalia rosae TaxID=37344 RepID=UPI0020344271|nr:neuferricin [Athalia rosae]XP_020711296.2 neuferricin [Athalia rosae]